MAHNAPVDIRARIRKVLAEHEDWSPRSVSLKAGLSDSMLSKFLNPDKKGGIQSITLETAERIAKALDVNPRWLVYGDAPMVMPDNVVHIWDRIPERRREQALAILETFTDDEDASEAG